VTYRLHRLTHVTDVSVGDWSTSTRRTSAGKRQLIEAVRADPVLEASAIDPASDEGRSTSEDGPRRGNRLRE